MGATTLYNVAGQTPLGAPSYLIANTNPPSAQLASTVQKIVAQVNFAAADTQQLVTHNWGLATSAPTFFDPQVIAEFGAGGVSASGTFLPAFTYDRSNTNVLKVNKVSTAVGSDCTVILTLRRPYSASDGL